jgi:hypothetical protein
MQDTTDSKNLARWVDERKKNNQKVYVAVIQTVIPVYSTIVVTGDNKMSDRSALRAATFAAVHVPGEHKHGGCGDDGAQEKADPCVPHLLYAQVGGRTATCPSHAPASDVQLHTKPNVISFSRVTPENAVSAIQEIAAGRLRKCSAYLAEATTQPEVNKPQQVPSQLSARLGAPRGASSSGKLAR